MRIEFSRKVRIQFLVAVITVMVITSLVHVFLETTSEIVILVSYFTQLLLSIGSFLLLARISQGKGDQVGFYFLGLSFVKFMVYLVGFRIYFMQDDVVTKSEYAIFFIPYIAALFIEIAFLVSVLNKVPVDLNNVIEYSDEEE